MVALTEVAPGGVPVPEIRRVAIVEDHVLVRDGLSAAVSSLPGVVITYQGDDTAAVLRLSPLPDLVLLDLELHGQPAAVEDVIGWLHHGSRVLVVSAMGLPDTARRLVKVGVSGFVSKHESTDTLLAAVQTALDGGTWTNQDLAVVLANDTDPDRPELSPQEHHALVLYASGLTLWSVARRMGLAQSTVREYLDRVRAKYEAVGRPARTKQDLYREALRDGIVEP